MQGYSTSDILSAVKNSGFLGKSPRQYNLLKYLLLKTEHSAPEQVKAYGIAIDVFKRSSNFDDTRDSIVRVEMHRLRKNLSAFNSTSENFTLHIPRASYAVEIRKKKATRQIAGGGDILQLLIIGLSFASLLLFIGYIISALNSKNISSQICSNVLPNVIIVPLDKSDAITNIVTRAFIMTLSQHSTLNVLNANKNCDQNITPLYFIEIDGFNYNGKTNVTIMTSHHEIGNIIHTNVINESTLNNFESRSIFYSAVRVANDLAKTNGVISHHASSVQWYDSKVESNYRCLITMYDSFVTDSEEDYRKSLSCLKNSINVGAPLLDNIGGLAEIYIAQAKGYRKQTDPLPYNLAEGLIAGLGEKWVESVEATNAKIFLDSERKNFSTERLKNTLTVAERHYSLNPHVLIQISAAQGLKLGDWNTAKRLSGAIKLIHSENDNSVFLVDAAHALITQSPDLALDTCILTYSENSTISNVIIYACANLAHDDYWAKKTKMNLHRLGLKNPYQISNFVRNRNFEPILTNKLLIGLKGE